MSRFLEREPLDVEEVAREIAARMKYAQELAPEILAFDKHILMVILYGLLARGELKLGKSDIDLCTVLNRNVNNYDKARIQFSL